MVIPDWTSSPRPPKLEFEPPPPPSDEDALFARPADRLAAVIVDVFVVLAPIYILLSAPLKKWMTMGFLVGAEGEVVTNVAGMAGIAVLLLVFYQTFMHHFFRATVGKLLFDLRVVPMFAGEPPTVWDWFVRAWAFVFEALLLGLPFLAVFANRRRRPWHDRVADTRVISRVDRRGVSAPAVWERATVRSVFAFALAVALAFTLSQVRGVSEKLKSEASFSSLADREASACEVVSRNFDEQGEEGETAKPHARLDMAMSLYAAGLVDRSCLEAEVERESATRVPVGPVTYLAQAFVHADDADVSNSYLDEVCENAPGSVECAMSMVVSRWSDEDWEGVEEALTRAPRGSGYLEVWGVRHFMKQARYGEAQRMLNRLIGQKYLAEFSLVQRVKTLFNSFHEREAEAALLQAVSTLPDTDGKELSAWMCAQQLQDGCGALESSACQQVEKLQGKIGEIDFGQSSDALARVLALECKGQGEVDYLSFSQAVSDESWQTFFRANLKSQKKDRSASAHLFSQVLLDAGAPELLKIEAARRWSQFADGAQMRDLFEQWRVMESKESWVKTGNILFKRLAEMRNDRLAIKVARHLLKASALSPQGLAALTRMGDGAGLAASLRAPASREDEEQEDGE